MTPDLGSPSGIAQRFVMQTRRVSILVIGLGCGGGGGAALVERLIRRVPGVVDVSVNAADATAYIRYDPARTAGWRLAEAIEDAGYRPGRPVES
jgi:P-type Cu+ transporter